jgi:hypothetical protein
LSFRQPARIRAFWFETTLARPRLSVILAAFDP